MVTSEICSLIEKCNNSIEAKHGLVKDIQNVEYFGCLGGSGDTWSARNWLELFERLLENGVYYSAWCGKLTFSNID